MRPDDTIISCNPCLRGLSTSGPDRMSAHQSSILDHRKSREFGSHFLGIFATARHDVAITGFDDLPIGPSFELGVTTDSFPSEAVARDALPAMRRRIQAPEAPPIKVLVPG